MYGSVRPSLLIESTNYDGNRMHVWLELSRAYTVACRELYNSYITSSVELSGAGFCPTETLREKIKDIDLFIANNIIPKLTRPCGCGWDEWKRAAYLNMSDQTRTCPPAWELIATPRRSCAWPSNANLGSCLLFIPTQGIQYSQVCERIIAGQPAAFMASGGSTFNNWCWWSESNL